MPIGAITVGNPLQAAPLGTPAAPASASGPFAQLFDQWIDKTNAQQTQANQAVLDLVTGKTDNVHDVTLAVSKADISFRLILEIRNRLLEAYQEISRMQI